MTKYASAQKYTVFQFELQKRKITIISEIALFFFDLINYGHYPVNSM